MPDAQFQKISVILPDLPISDTGSVYNRSLAELKDLLARDSAGRIGVVGLPGTGKTTLMQMACHGFLSPDRSRRLGLIVPVPAGAAPNDIARQLVLSLCTALLGERGGPLPRRDSGSTARKTSLISSVAVVAGAVLLAFSAKGIRINTQMGLGWILILAGAIGLLSQFSVQVDGFRNEFSFQRLLGASSAGDSVSRSRKLYKRIAALVDMLEAERRFETTVTSGWTAGLTPLTGLQFGSSGSVSKKVLPTSLPDLAEYFAQLVAEVSAETPLLVGIDGLDKRDPGSDIDQTLFELRHFLTVHGCRYLIALRENPAPRSSSRSSMIDATVRCELLTVDDARKLIERGVVIGLPDTFAALCFAASGGLPREMLRNVRLVVDRSKDQPDVSIMSVCNTMVEQEIQVLADELRWVARALPSWTQQEQLFDWADRLSCSPPEANRILAVANDIRTRTITESNEASYDGPNLTRITHRAAALAYWYATLIDFFTGSLDTDALQRALAPSVASASLDRLAEARRLIDLATCGPAWMAVSAFRAEWGMPITPITDSTVG